MSLSPRERRDLRFLILQALEGTIGDEDKTTLTEWLFASKEARSFYLDVIEFNSVLQEADASCMQCEPAVDETGVFNKDLMSELLKYEQEAPSIVVSKPPQSLKSPPPITETPTKFYHIIWFKLALSTIAAVVIFSLIINWLPQRFPVAYVVDCKDVKWKSSETSFSIGDTLYSTDRLWHLEQGYVSLKMECGAEVYIEGPAVFAGRTEKSLYLQKGKTCSYLAVENSQFTVETPTSQVLDLGTEFGVQVSQDGSSTVQVYEGETEFTARSKRHGLQKRRLESGKASRVNLTTGRMTKTPYNPSAFTRYVDPQTGFVWHGDPINLADMTASGNGFETGIPNAGLSVTTGTIGMYQTEHIIKGNGDYIPITDNPFIDGIFVVCKPGQQISTEGLTSEDLPSTDALTWGGLIRHQTPNDNTLFADNLNRNPNDSILSLSSNTGITFDLFAIKQATPWLKIKQFISHCYTTEARTNARVAILIDGHEKWQTSISSNASQWEAIDVPIDTQSRFLTLLVTVEPYAANQAQKIFFLNPELSVDRQIATMQ